MVGRRTIPVLVTTVVLAIAALAPPASAAVDPLVPPTVLAPADGATVQAGTTPAFRVQTGEGDQYLWVHFSASPNPVAACGTIGSDNGLLQLQPTMADPAVYEGTPAASDLYTFWLNRPGTYYWQAYRIHNGGGADGCVEAPVRSLTVTGTRPVEIGPQPLEPADGATITAGPVTFKVSAPHADATNYYWIAVSRSAQPVDKGVIGHEAEIEALTATADPNLWTAAPVYFSTPTFWMNTAGVYYWQPYRISYFGDPDGAVEGPVRSFTIQAAPTTPGTPTTPTTPTTVRGAEAFTKGTANDLYLACTKLDLYLVDVLPAGAKVAVTGAADLRLAGKTADILLDGVRVGSAVIGPGGAFAATVRAPSRARRATARYQARVGTTLSQNLKLERRMVAAKLTRKGATLKLTGRITKPFARRAATIAVQRYRSCQRKDGVPLTKTVRPTRTGSFTATFAVPADSVQAVMYRASTKVAARTGGAATQRTYTLPRALDVR